MNITPEKTVVESLGPRGIKSPLQLARSRGEGCGAFVPDEARVRYQIETGTGYDLPTKFTSRKPVPGKDCSSNRVKLRQPLSPAVVFARVSTTLFALRCWSFTITMACRKCWAFPRGTRAST